jgi:hypothetical protein
MAPHSLELQTTPVGLAKRWDSPTTSTPGLTRRHLLKVGGSAVALASFGGAAHWLSLFSTHTNAALRRSTWEGLVGSQVTVQGDHTIGVRLVDIADLPGTRPEDREGAFSLLFHGGSPARLPQGVYLLSHPAIGTARMLFTPAGTGRAGQDYAVVVNRVKHTSHREEIPWPRTHI